MKIFMSIPINEQTITMCPYSDSKVEKGVSLSSVGIDTKMASLSGWQVEQPLQVSIAEGLFKIQYFDLISSVR